MSRDNERRAHRLMTDTAKMRTIDAMHDHINRERRKPATVGQRAPETVTKVAEHDQSAIEAGIWPVYIP